MSDDVIEVSMAGVLGPTLIQGTAAMMAPTRYNYAQAGILIAGGGLGYLLASFLTDNKVFSQVPTTVTVLVRAGITASIATALLAIMAPAAALFPAFVVAFVGSTISDFFYYAIYLLRLPYRARHSVYNLGSSLWGYVNAVGAGVTGFKGKQEAAETS